MANRSTALLLSLLAASAWATELPREGAVDSSLCFGGPMHVVAAAPDERFGTYVVRGGTTANDMAFDSMTSECAGAFVTKAGRTQSQGYCVFRDATGDTIHGTDALTPEGSFVWQYLGGTGKFKGITGSGTLQRVGTLAPGEGQMRGCRRIVGTYKLL